ncbi:hypothetical protein, partial [Salmonella enterica]|uniref:hypothetical protein n=1 Tax=Salmonella enterica TaxID=28901 RepID=UPI003CF6D667
LRLIKNILVSINIQVGKQFMLGRPANGIRIQGYYNTIGAINRLKPQKLFIELKESGHKYNQDKVVMITKNYFGKLMWL